MVVNLSHIFPAKAAAIMLIAALTSCQHNYFEDAINRENDTEAPRVTQAEPADGSTLRKLESLRIKFSEPVLGADSAGAYAVSGDGAGTLAVASVDVQSSSEVVVQFSGTMVDGSVVVKLSGVRDKVANALASAEISYTSDATPKWRYIGRAVSTNTIITSSAPAVAHDAQYLYVAINEVACVNAGVNDITVMRYEFSAGTWSTIGNRCIAGATATASSINPSLLLHNGTLFVAFTDGLTYDGTNTLVRVRAWRNNQWELIGATIGANTKNPAMVADGDNIYVSVRDTAVSNRAAVYRNTIATPGTWTLMGTNGLSLGNIFRSAPLIIFGSELYVGFRDGGSSAPTSKPSVFKWDGASSWATSWQIDTLAADNVNLLQSGSELWAIYQQGGTSAVAVTKFSAGTWSQAFANLTTEGTPNYLSARVSGSNTYVGYQVGSSSACWVKRHDGTTWAVHGTSFNCGNPTITLVGSLVYAVFRDQDTGYLDKFSAAYYQ